MAIGKNFGFQFSIIFFSVVGGSLRRGFKQESEKVLIRSPTGGVRGAQLIVLGPAGKLLSKSRGERRCLGQGR